MPSLKLYTQAPTGENLQAYVWATQTTNIYDANAEALVPFNEANMVDYETALTEFGSSGTFVFDMPTGIPPGVYYIQFWQMDVQDPPERELLLQDWVVEWLGTGLGYVRVKPLLDAAALISAGQPIQLITSPLLLDGEAIVIHKGASYTAGGNNAIVANVPPDVIDLSTGYTIDFGMKKLVENEGAATFDTTGSVEDAGTPDQRILIELTKAQTDTFALSNEFINPFAMPTGRAYRFALSVSSDPVCRVLAQGEVDVREKISQCSA